MGLSTDLGSFITALYAGTGKGVSDGLYQKDLDHFSAGWILKVGGLELKQERLYSGSTQSRNVYSEDLGGILGLLVILCILEELVPPDAPYDVVIA